MGVLYDTIGVGYSNLRKPDRRIADAIYGALADAKTVVNVGAGTGSYEPRDRQVVAVEPSITMIRQRPPGSAAVVQGIASALPFRDDSFDASLAILTIHHWEDRQTGIRELQRTARDRVVIFTWDPTFPGFWLTDYLPEIMDIDRPIFPDLEEFESLLGPLEVIDVPIPHDCTDGFMCAYWRRPEAYLDPSVRTAISTFPKIRNVQERLGKLEKDLCTGAWTDRYAEIAGRRELDCGYRLLVARC